VTRQADFRWPTYTSPAEADDMAERLTLLDQIPKAAKLFVLTLDPADAIVGKIYPPGRLLPWPKKLLLWRLEGLEQPLWIGSDGVIYRAYDEWGGSNARLFREGIAKAHYWRVAEIENRKIAGLKRLLHILTPDPEA